MRERAELTETSVGIFEVDWYVDVRSGELYFALDPDGGRADSPEMMIVSAVCDVVAALQSVGVPEDEANELAPGLWERRWRGP